MADTELLASVVEFKQRFYPPGWARYDQAKRGTFRLMPSAHVLAAVEADYRQMRSMFFGDVPEFNSILQALGELEREINTRFQSWLLP
ncbi:MAG: hypothetical protein Q7V56_09595 [Gammaproteobacteria bacterium]|nr:hypothetical protein [Gammaproteobacteria bacterium]